MSNDETPERGYAHGVPGKCSTGSSTVPTNSHDRAEGQRVDPRLVLLLRAPAQLHLVEAGYQSLDTAFAELVPAFREIAAPPCECEAAILKNFTRHERALREQQLRLWRWRS